MKTPAPDSATILLVDDEDAVQKLLTYPLEREGFRVLQARDGEEALRRFGQEADPAVHEPALERGHENDPDDREGAGDDDRQREAEAGADAPEREPHRQPPSR